MTRRPNPRTTVKDKTIRRVLGFFLLISAVLVFVAVLAVRNITRSVASSDWVNHTHAVILEVDGIFSALQAGDGAMRTYVMSGDARDQAACREAFASVAEHVEVAKALTRGEPAQNAQIVRLETLANKREEFAHDVLGARRADQAETVRTLLAEDAGRGAIREIQRAVEKLKEEEMALLAERDTASYQQAQTTRWTVWSGVAVDFLLLAGVAWLIRDDIAARQRAAAVLQEANEQLEARVSERTAELASANEQLTAENLERRWAIQALEHQLRYNELIVNSVGDLVFVLTKVMNISRINPAVVHLTGREPPELINRPLAQVVRLTEGPGAASAPKVDLLAHALREGRDLRDLPASVEDRRGHKTAVRLTLFPLRDRDKVVGGVVILQIVRPAAPART